MVVRLICTEDGEDKLIDLDELCLFGEEKLRECDEETLKSKWHYDRNSDED